jgi:hypothetical protein
MHRVLCVGVVLGLCMAVPANLLAQGVSLSAWTQPPVVMAILGMFISIGSARQMVMDDRRRITAIEERAVLKEAYIETMRRIDGSLERIDESVEELKRRRT